jgi:two-component system, NarL family, nitrate/nitrite response regulator NarL
MIKILLADKQPTILRGLQMNLSLESDCLIVGSTSSSSDLLMLYHKLQPDVIVVDVAMLSEAAGQELMKQAAEGNGRIIAHSIYDNRALRTEALTLGAKAFVLKQGGSQQLLAAIRQVSER